MKYYRKENVVIKRDSDTSAIVVTIPKRHKSIPLMHYSIELNKEAFESLVSDWEEVDVAVWDSYLATFFQSVEKNRQKFGEYRSKKYEAITDEPKDNRG